MRVGSWLLGDGHAVHGSVCLGVTAPQISLHPVFLLKVNFDIHINYKDELPSVFCGAVV